MDVLLLGAGASYGSDVSGTPPLGDDLFRALQAFSPTLWGALPTNLETKFIGDFEAGMNLVAQRYPHDVSLLQRAMAAFFFEFYPRKSNSYVRLASRIHDARWNGAICTLNYDRLIELSLGSVGLQPVIGTNTLPGRSIELCMPHGCCHIFCDSVKGMPSAVSFAGMNVKTNGAMRVISDPTEFRNRIQNDAFPPAMCYFEPSKSVTAGESFIMGQRDRWRDLVSNADRIAIIGVRVRPHDDHIWDPLSRTAGQIIYCSGRLAADEFRTWAECRPLGSSDLVLEKYFSDALNEICHELTI
ncbi:MAG: hypothetical protein UZ17_ACD001002181 [Acidobacteria bacterium OLB17]|nr:MAG: hypothetical protein UZ17_ACD001002181 [Acidobacteria bacterium OLB17]